jgi:hypothetical protein
MEKAKALLASWARSFLAASLAVYLAGQSDLETIAKAGLAAVLPVIIRWLNPKDTKFGVNS